MDRFESTLARFKACRKELRGHMLSFTDLDNVEEALTLAQQPKAKGSVGEAVKILTTPNETVSICLTFQDEYRKAIETLIAAAEETAHWRSIAITVEKRLMARVEELEKAAKHGETR